MNAQSPIVEQSTTQDYIDITNGVFEGLTDVFGYDSLQVRCRTNFTVGYDAFYRLFLDSSATYNWGDSTW